MNKILLLTLHSQNNNFGSVLQGYALYHYLEKKGNDVTMLDYQPYYANGEKNNAQKIKARVRDFIFEKYFKERQKRFDAILNMENRTKLATTYDELPEISQGYDIYMIGSDQVWNPGFLCGRDPAYYWSFIQNGNKYAYAASMGSAEHKAEIYDELSERTKDFTAISLRENISAEQMRKHGRTDAEYVLDPVFLLNVQEYRSMQTDRKERGCILAYIIHKDAFMEKVVDELARLTNKKVVQIGGFASKCQSDTFIREAGPADFLSLIDNADFIITSSFHGTAFAHIYNKQFAVVMPNNNTLRLKNILGTAGTQNRVITDMNDVAKMVTESINYDQVNKRIDNMREKSYRFIEKALGREDDN